jgi:RNA polymerase sigma-70 factor (ECF subfamily)
MSTRDLPAREPGPGVGGSRGPDLDWLLGRVARGDQAAFEDVYDQLAGPVFGLICKVGAQTWVMMIAHRRAVDRVRSASAETQRDQRSAAAAVTVSADEVAETVEANLEAERVRRCLDGLTDLQRESVTLAYYGGYSYREVAGLLSVALGTIKTRIRDGLIRMRDCLGVSW